MSTAKSAVALGFFDGVHIAHRKIISSAVSYARENSLYPIALTFDKSPLEVLAPEKVSYLTTPLQKERLISAMGAKTQYLNVSETLLNMSAEDFIVHILIEKYNIKYAVCGYNYRFGKNGDGNTDMLRSFGEKYGFSVKVCDCVSKSGDCVSSSRIRSLITSGNIAEANTLLGRNFSIEGTVCEGKHLGRTIGFPTANIFLDDMTVIPKKGVYKTRVTFEGKTFKAITNTGINPTVGGERLRTETYIPSLSENLYGKNLTIEFVDFIRPETEFENISQLQKQIIEDLKKI